MITNLEIDIGINGKSDDAVGIRTGAANELVRTGRRRDRQS